MHADVLAWIILASPLIVAPLLAWLGERLEEPRACEEAVPAGDEPSAGSCDVRLAA